MKWFLLFLFGSSISLHAEQPIRIGHFPNVTHAQAVMAQASGEFEKKVGTKIEWKTFNAGPSAMEALMAGAIDVTYVGPNPAINAFIKTQGQGLRVISGSAGGGAALVVRSDMNINSDKDFNGKIIATPQLGNTQDVAARTWFKEKGYATKETGGTLTLLPIANPEQLLLFQRKSISGAWTVEPWVSRLVIEGGGKIFLEEKNLWPDGKYVTTHLVVNKKFLDKNRALVKKLVSAHVELTQQLNANKKQSIVLINAELKKETGKELPQNVIDSAMDRLEFTWDPISSSLFKSAKDAQAVGLLKDLPDLSSLYDLSLLNEVLAEKKLPVVK
jgi:NitT/TauT family transport system substrate-binding protein